MELSILGDGEIHLGYGWQGGGGAKGGDDASIGLAVPVAGAAVGEG